MKKRIWIIALCLLVALAFASCGGKKAEKSPSKPANTESASTEESETKHNIIIGGPEDENDSPVTPDGETANDSWELGGVPLE